MSECERPREKLMKYGPEKLSNEELLAVILRTGKKGQNVLELSKKILTQYHKELSEISYKKLSGVSGVGPAKATQIIASFELGKRLIHHKVSRLILGSKDVWEEMREFRKMKKEHCVVFFLDARQQEIKREVISVGTLTKTLVHPREVYEPAVKYNAAQIIFSHNHPSDDVTPSKEDIEITHRLSLAGKLLGIEFVDHVIVSETKFMSMKEQGYLPDDEYRGEI